MPHSISLLILVAAMGNFQKYGLDGPTKFEDLGEKYLRLYGFLNATYIQQAAVLSLYKFLNVPNPKEAKKRIEVLKIREVWPAAGFVDTILS